MDRKTIIIALFALVVSIEASAQVETSEQNLSTTTIDNLPVHIEQQPMVDSLNFRQNAYQHEKDMANYRTMNYTTPTNLTVKPFWLWNNTNITVSGITSQMPGLMDMATGTISLNHNAGRLHLSALAIANKYWMPMQSNLYTQYGFGGTIGYDLSENVALHAFGYYYANNPLVAPAFSPYVSTTAFGGYADIQISEHFGTEVGVRRYVNPMTGRWTTEPIVTPYVKVGKIGIGLPVGALLKSMVWGDNDNPTRFRPPQPQPKKK